MKPVSYFFALIISLTFCLHANARQELSLGTPFAENAILQREMKVPVWGWSEPGTKVTVEFAGQKKDATAGESGKWMLELEPLKASAEPAEMIVSEGGGKSLKVGNILVGEVWMASGQSNMQWVVSKCDVGQVLLKGITERVEAGEEKAPVIREGKVTNYYAALHPIEHATAEWSDAGGDSSAIAYAFAYKLHRELGVPVGILNCSFSQTSIQAWTPRVGFAGGEDEYTKALYQEILQTDPATPEHKAAWGKFYQDIEDTLAENKELVAQGKEAKDINTKTPGNMKGNRDSSWLFNARLNPMIPYAIKGAIWNQGYANMGEGMPYYHNLHSMIRGWRELWGRPELPVYFHQFYCPGQKDGWDNSPSIGSTAEMRLGTWLARDIPNTGMASQIDITGAIHYGNKTLPGQRLALHALKNQYGKDVAVDGPMFKSYGIKGDKLIVALENADGLQVAETGTNSKSGLAVPTVIPNGEDQVKLFYLAGEDRVWHPASIKISGNNVIVSSPQVKAPRGVSYATGGVGNQPNLYNAALLPATPFIYYDNKLVTSEAWPDDPMKIAGVVLDPSEGGLLYEYRKMPILSSQFRDNAVLQADVPVTIWGSAVHDWGHDAKGKAVINFSFGEIEKTIPVEPGMKEWSVTLPVMEAGTKPYTLKASLEIDGELAHERTAENIIFGDVFYVGAPAARWKLPQIEKSDGVVRMMTRKAKRSSFEKPSRFSVAVSTTPLNRFASLWEDAAGPAAVIGHRIAKKTGRPVGIIFMQTAGGKDGPDTALKEWIAAGCLNMAPSLMEDYKELAGLRPGNEYFDANVNRYVAAWKKYWGEYVPEMIATKSVPDEVPWGSYPSLASSIETNASETYNTLVHSFTPASLKGIIFLSSPTMVEKDQGTNFGEQVSALANCLKGKFGDGDVPFVYSIPSGDLAAKVTKPASIKGKNQAVEVGSWEDGGVLLKATDAVIE
jgi:sialate O-acetylesterase